MIAKLQKKDKLANIAGEKEYGSIQTNLVFPPKEHPIKSECSMACALSLSFCSLKAKRWSRKEGKRKERAEKEHVSWR